MTIVFTWTIDNILNQTETTIISPAFTIANYSQIGWHLQLHPRSWKNPDFISIWIKKISEEFEVEIEFELVIVGRGDGQVDKSMAFKKVFENKNNRCDCSWEKAVSRNELADSRFLVDGNLTIQVKNVRVIRVVELKDRLNATVFSWDIDDFASQSQNQLTSAKFTIPGHPLIKWQVICYPKNNKEKSVFKLIKCTDDCEIEIEFQLMIYGKQETRKAKFTDVNHFRDQQSLNSWEWPISINQLNHYLMIDRKLIVQVKVFRILRIDYLNDYLNRRLNKEALDLNSLKEHSDFRLKTGDKTFDVHKFVLARDSPYFKTMFDGNFKEKRKNEVDLSQFQPKVIQEVVRFIYTGQLQNFDILSSQLIIAADYFQMDYLKTLCQENMSFHLSLDNCLELLKIADQVNASLLKEAAMRFLSKNKSRFNKQALTKFFKEYAELGVEWMLWSS